MIKICLDDPETRAVWETVLEARREVASWPAWKRGDVQPLKENDMGMANKAPPPRYARKHTISHHALERFRERVDEDVKARSNFDVGNLLDEKVCQSTRTHSVRDPRAPEAITMLHEIELRSGVYYAVVRDETVITVLDETMVRTNFAMANWKPTMNSPFTRAALGTIQAVPPRKLTPNEEAVMRGDLLPPPKPVPVAPAPSPLEAAGAAYALAMRAKRDAKLVVERLQADLVKAEEALQQHDAEIERVRVVLEALVADDG